LRLRRAREADLGRAGRLRRVALALLVAAVVVIAATAVAFGPGTYDVYSRTVVPTDAQLREAPPWTRTCWGNARVTTHTRCVHIAGRIAWIQHHDPDGDGDRHMIVVVHLHPRIVKIGRELGVRKLPRIGTRVDATGFLTESASGHEEIDAMAFETSGDVRRSIIGHRTQ
jgi:hypothetical protein